MDVHHITDGVKLADVASAHDPVSAIPAAAAGGRIQARRGEDATGLLDLAARLAAPTGELQRIAPAACAAAEAARLAGRAEDIDDITVHALDLVSTHPERWVLGELLWWRSLAGLPVFDGPAAPAGAFAAMVAGHWHEAALAWESLGCPLWQAHALGLADDVALAQRAVGILEGLRATAAVEALLRTRRERGLRLPRRPRQHTRERVGQLTSREFDILLLLADGLSTAELADRLVLSPPDGRAPRVGRPSQARRTHQGPRRRDRPAARGARRDGVSLSQPVTGRVARGAGRVARGAERVAALGEPQRRRSSRPRTW